MMPTAYFRGAAAVLLVCVFSTTLFGQVFLGGAVPTTAADIGVAELTGFINFAVLSGTVPGPLTIKYSAPITNNEASEITITGTGGLAGIDPAPLLDLANNSVTINIPSGGYLYNALRVSGVRVAIAGTNATSVTATVVSPNNPLGNGPTFTVIDTIVSPISIDLTSAPLLAYSNGVATVGTSTFVVAETYIQDFSDTVGFAGQTTPTFIRVSPFPPLPTGVKVTFSAVARSKTTGAILTTVSGRDETVPRADGSTSVFYQFSSDPSPGVSDQVRESFEIPVALVVQPTAGSGNVTFQASMAPIGVANPDDIYFPSTDIPRYWERSVPDAYDLTGTVEEIPFRSSAAAIYTGVAVTNPTTSQTSVLMTAYDANGQLISGTGITNPVMMPVIAGGQFAKLATEIFGTGLNASRLGTIRVQGNGTFQSGFYELGNEVGPGIDGSTIDTPSAVNWIWPTVFRQAPSPYTTLEVFNPNTATANVAMTLCDSSGTKLATASRSLAAHASMVEDISTVFAIDWNSFAGGYITGVSDIAVVARETFGNSLDSNVLPAQVTLRQSTYFIPHFVSGGGYSTELNLINTDPIRAENVTVTLLDNNGTAIGNAAVITIPMAGQATSTIADLFPSLSGLASGSIRVDVALANPSPFSPPPSLVGSIRFSAAGGYGSSALPLYSPPSLDFVYSNLVQDSRFYTGVSFLNTNSTAATIALQVYGKQSDGSIAFVGSYSTTLSPGQKIAKVISELVPGATGWTAGYIRVHATQPVTSFSFFGSNDGLSLSAIPLQKVGN